ncbi:hypothetical protein CDEST_01943 [Colletotrichum destructivum]|uniref:Ferric oxidoreductase domain-containing protein n=1 Tax=Colletotrichum destructivum TaxID=34406 RepID=A0AAX4I1I8_9PEZI|nr:hypothetical protein CDEST_01943 [Colletotrichum destructivum]
MQKYCKETPGIDDLDRWPPDSDGFAFLVAIDSASSIDELQNVGSARRLVFASLCGHVSHWYLQHPLVRHRDTDCLLGLLSLARVSVFPRDFQQFILSNPFFPIHSSQSVLFQSILFVSFFHATRAKSFSVPFCHPDHDFVMDWVTTLYAICLAGMTAGLVLVNVLSRTSRARRRLAHLLEKHLLYRLLVHRHSLFGPWNVVSLLLPAVYMGVNAFCLAFRPSTFLSRSGNLALLNTLPLFASSCLDFTADILALPFRHYAAMHRWQGRVAAMLLAAHIVSAMQNDKYQVQVPDGINELLLLIVMGTLFLLSPARELASSDLFS